MFTSSPDYYTRNLEDAARFTAGRAKMCTPDGREEPGIVLRNGKAIRAIMPESEALRLANEIADALGKSQRDTSR